MKFCPNCGTARVANFCAGCGFNFLAAGTPGVAQAPTADASSNEIQANPAGWYPDPVDSKFERLWNGNAWTQETRPLASVSAVQPAYGEGFSIEKNCGNCGEPNVSTTIECKLCGHLRARE